MDGADEVSKKVKEAAGEISYALLKTLQDMSMQLQTKFDIDVQMLNLAIAKATAETAATAAISCIGGNVDEAKALDKQLDEILRKAIKERRTKTDSGKTAGRISISPSRISARQAAPKRAEPMNPRYRSKLLAVMSSIEQKIAEAEALTMETSDDEILPGASQQLAELRRVLGDLERKLNGG